jgi:hypothetical protein
MKTKNYYFLYELLLHHLDVKLTAPALGVKFDVEFVVGFVAAAPPPPPPLVFEDVRLLLFGIDPPGDTLFSCICVCDCCVASFNVAPVLLFIRLDSNSPKRFHNSSRSRSRFFCLQESEMRGIWLKFVELKSTFVLVF